jgi:hypothetical protein
MDNPEERYEEKQNKNKKSFTCGNRNGHHNTELRTSRRIKGQYKKLKR